MQINGVGSGGVHNHNMHQVTDCRKEHNVSKKGSVGGAAASSQNLMQKNVNQYTQQSDGFSLSSWWKKLLAAGQKLYIGIWGEAPAAKSVDDTKQDGLQDAEQVMAALGDEENGQTDVGAPLNTVGAEMVAGAAMTKPDLHNNPYFSAIEDTGKQKQTAWEKVRVRFYSLTGQLSGRFSGRNSFEARQQKPKEDLRKHSRYRQDDLEIDCILTDDSYLLDSYDRKGEYSKLSPKK